MDAQLNLTVNKKKCTLVAGYVRSNQEAEVPDDITKVILELYDEVVSFNIDYDTLQKFLSGDNLFGGEFNVKNQKFRCAMYPNRSGEQFSLQLLLQPAVSKVVAYFAMYNIQADTFWKGAIKFDADGAIADHERSPDDVDSEAEIESDKLKSKWCEQGLPLLNCSEYTALDLSIWCQILCIKYKPDHDSYKTDYFLPIKLKKNVKYSWIVEKEKLKEWVDCEILKAFSTDLFPFGEEYSNWVTKVVPNGYCPKSKGKVIWFLDLTRMPYGIKCFEADWKLKVEFGNKCVDKNGKKVFGYGLGWQFHMFTEEDIFNDMFKDCECIKWTVQIEITKVFDWNGDIKASDWLKFGVES